jgi:signal transduction histidine kinase
MTPFGHNARIAEAQGAPISEASRQLRALAMLSGSLTDPLTPEDAAEVVERQALAVLGATSAVVMTLGQFPPAAGTEGAATPAAAGDSGRNGDGPGETLALLHAIGAPADVAGGLTQLPLDADMPLAEVARTGEAVFLKSESDLRRYPGWCESMLRTGSRSAAAVPVWANGHLRGVLGLTWAVPRTFDEDERAFVLTIGVMCAQAIMRGHLKAAEQRARETAEHANLAKTQFLRTMSHELRTPLTAVVGYTELLETEIVGPVTDMQRDHLGRIRRSSDHLLSLIEELLNFAQIEAGEQVVRVQRVRAADAMEETLDIVRPIAEGKDVRILFDIRDHRIELRTDRVKLRQILVNLVTNAVKYTDTGEVRVAVRTTAVDTDPSIFFEVTDSGRGIAIDDREHVFEPFWQADQSLTRVSGGTGLGLSVARQLARLLGGDITLGESALGGGSTFVLGLPVTYQEPLVEAASPE